MRSRISVTMAAILGLIPVLNPSVVMASPSECDSCSEVNKRMPAVALPTAQLLHDAAVDPDITPETAQLLDRLRASGRPGSRVGHHASTLYGLEENQSGGRTLWRNDGARNTDRSDVKTGTGSHAALLGLDIEDMIRAPFNPKTKSDEEELRRNAVAAARRGQVVTISWHAHDPVNPSWNYREYADRVKAQKAREPLNGPPSPEDVRESEALKRSRCDAVLNDSEVRKNYIKSLADMGAFFSSLRDEQNRPIPILFRPFHEQTGDWFWWGKGHCSEEDYAKLWQLTVKTLRDDLQVHNLLYVYSPNQKRDTAAEYYQGYPGDRYVDVLALDAYHDLDTPAGAAKTGKELGWMVREARARGKVAALAETGLESFRTGPYGGGRTGEPNPKWFSQNLGLALESDPDARDLAYIMVWRNGSESHHYFPAPWQKDILEDFALFRSRNDVLLLDDWIAAPAHCKP